MADIQSNINVNINASEALSTIKALQKEISAFHTQMATQGAQQAARSNVMQQQLVSSINAGGAFYAQMKSIATTSESFTTSLEKNKLSMGEYFRYSLSSTKAFGSSFASEMATVDRTAVERVKTLQTQYIQMGRDANGAMKAIAVRPLTLDMQDLGTQTQIAAQKHQIFNQLIDQGSTNLLNWGKNTQWAGRQLMVGFSLPLAAFAVTAGKAFMDLEKAAVDFKRVYGDATTPTSEGDAMTKQVEQLATTFTQYGVAVSSTMKMAADAAAQGATGAALLEQVNQTGKLSVLGGVTQQQSLQTITSLTNTFGIATKDLATNIDFLNAVENQTVLSISDMTDAIPIAAPVVAQLGGNVKDLTVMLTAMKAGGISATEGANALKSGLASMINPTTKATDALGALGINVKGIRDANQGNASGMISELATQLDKLDPLNRAQAIEQLFGKFQFARMSTLLENINKQGGQAARALELTKMSASELANISDKELSRIAESPAFKFQKAIADIQLALAPVGEAFIKFAVPIINFGTQVLQWFNSLGDGAKSFVIGLVVTLGAIAPVVLMGIGLIANGAANIIKFVQGISKGIMGLFNSKKILGEQTAYLSDEELRAGAVAASLDQIHQTLEQRFTSEADAVNLLIKAYEKMVGLQDGMAMPLISAGATRTNVATGTAKSVGETSESSKTQFSHIGSSKNIDFVALQTMVDEAPDKFNARMKTVIAEGVGIFGDKVGMVVGSRLGIRTGESSQMDKNGNPQAINNLMAKQGVSGAEFMADWDKQGLSRWKDSLRYANLKMENVSEDLISVDSAMKEYLLSLRSDTQITDKVVEQAFVYAREKVGADNKLMQSFDALSTTMGEARLNISQAIAREFGLEMFSDSKGRENASVKIGNINSRIGGERLQNYGGEGPEIPGGTIDQELSVEKKKVKDSLGAFIAAQAEDTASTQTLKDAKRRGVSAVMEEIFSEEELSVINGLDKVEKNLAISARRKENLNNTYTVLATKDFTEGQIAATAKLKQLVAALDTNILATEELTLADGSATIATEQVTIAKEGSAIVGGSVPSSSRGSGLSMGIGKASAIGMGAMALGGVASMIPGAIGEVAGAIMPVIMSLSMLLPLLQMLPAAFTAMLGPIGLVALGVAGVVTVLILMAKHLDDVKQSAKAAAEATAITTKAMTDYAAATGTTNPSEIMDAQRKAQQTGIAQTAATPSFGTTYLQGDPGKKLQSDFEKAITEVGTSSAVNGLSNQLATAVSAGIMTSVQASDIATTLGKNLNNAGLSADINGKLTSLLGPQGQNLTTDPLSVYVKLIADTSGTTTDAFSQLTKGSNWWDASATDTIAKNEEKAASGTTSMLTQNKLLSDSLELQHQKRLSSLQAEGDISKINAENKQYEIDRLSLLTKSNTEYSTLVDNFKKATPESQSAVLQSISKGLQDQMKGTSLEGAMSDSLKAISKTQTQGYRNGNNETLTDEEFNKRVSDEKAIQIKNNSKLTEATAVSTTQTDFKRSLIPDMSKEVQLTLTGNLKAGNIDVGEFTKLTKLIDPANNGKVYDSVANITAGFGGPAASQVMALLNSVGGTNQGAAIAISAVIDTQTTGKSPEEVQKILNTYTDINNLGQSGIDLIIQTQDPDAAKRDRATKDIANLQDAVKGIDSYFADGQKKTYSVDMKFGSTGFDLTAQEAEYFNSLSASDQKVYTTAYLTVKDTIDISTPEGQKALDAWSKGKKDYSNGGGKIDYAAESKDYQAEYARSQVKSANANPEPAVPLVDPNAGLGNTGGGASTPTSMLDNLVSKLKQVQMATAQVTLGWQASRTALDNMFPGGAASSPFDGLEQQMRRLGAKENLITTIAGMDPAEFEKRKNELFTFDGAGNITGFRESLLSIGEAMKSIAFGTFQSNQQATIAKINDQMTATNKLVAAGYSYAQALEITKDAALASAIAQEADANVIKTLTADYAAATLAAKNLAAAQGLAATTAAAVDKAALAAKLAKDEASGSITKNQATSILADSNLQQLYMNPAFSPATLQAALDTAANAAALDLKVKKLTIEGLDSIFQDGFNKAMEAFAAQQKSIEIKFAVQEDPLKAIIKNAQNAIQDINQKPGGLNDLNADLQRISDKEKIINDQYAIRQKALNSISQINAAIVNQNKAQLTIADALTQGDISAAAKAIQDARVQAAGNFAQSQQQLLDASKQAELDAVTANYGLTRKQLEASILTLKTQVFNIEQNTIAPAQYRLDILARTKANEIDSLTVLGKTKVEWENIKNKIDLAKTSSALYTAAMNDALGVVKDILSYWTEAEKPKATTYTVTTIHVDNYVTSGNVAASGDTSTGAGNASAADQAAADQAAASAAAYAVSSYGFSNRFSAAMATGIGTNYGPGKTLMDLYYRYKNATQNLHSGSIPGSYISSLNDQLVSMGYNTGGLVDGTGNTDKISAMLTPGEFVVTKPAVAAFGASNLANINSGKSMDNPVYNNNYSIVVNAKSDANPDQIAKTVIAQIKQVNDQRIRGNRF